MELLVKRACRHDADAFCELMDANMQSMYKVAKAYLKNDEDAADAIQDTILACYEKIDTLKNSQYFKTWLIRILINKCDNVLKKSKRTVPEDTVREAAKEDMNYSNLEWNELLNRIDEKYRTILILYYVEGFNTREIAQLLDMNENTIKSRLQRGRARLCELYRLPLRKERKA